MQKPQHRIPSFNVYTRPLWRRLIYAFALVALMVGSYFYPSSSALAQSGSASVTDCSTFGSVGEAGTLADALATSSSINFDCTGTIIVPEIFVTQDLAINGQEGVILSAGGNNRVLSVAGGIQVALNDLILEDGNGNVNEVAIGNVGEGGNIYNAGSLTINNSTIGDNLYTQQGGGIFNIGQLDLNNVTFDGGGGSSAGGIFNGGEARARGLTMKNLGSDGGFAAIFNRDNMVIDNCLIENTSSRFSEAIGNSGTLVMNDCVMRRIGSIDNFSGGALSLNRITLDDNAGVGWAIDNAQNSTMSLAGITISNVAPGTAPIHNDGDAQIQNSTISDNLLPNSNAILNNGTMTVMNSTVANNQPLPGASVGGGIQNDGTLTLSDTIVAENGSNCSGSMPITSNGYNLDSDGSCNLNATGDISNGNANLGPLQNNGGPTFTHGLQTGSDAIDAGNCSDDTISTDQRGIARPQGEACDIGAYELDPDNPPVDSTLIDRDALIALYNSTDGDNWLDNTNWLEGDHCDWYGIECNDSGQVTLVDLLSNQLSGTIPPELGNLTSLIYLLLGENPLTGTIPPKLGNLTNLEQIYINDTQISGSIPPELGNLSNLVFALFLNNQLSGSIPPELGNLTNLTFLHLGENQLSGPIPAELGNLANLLDLYLYDNQLSGTLPLEFGNLNNLGLLALEENLDDLCVPIELQSFINGLGTYGSAPGGFCGQEQSPDRAALIALYNSTDGDNWINNTNWLEGDHCAWFGVRCANGLVVELTLSANQLSGTIPPEFGNLTNLEVLELFENPLSGPIPPEMGNLASLALLFMNDTQLSGPIPPDLGNLPDLVMLNLRNNQLSGPIPEELGQPTGLFFIDLGNNQLSGEIPAAVAGLPQLEFFDLENNQFTGPVPAELGNSPNLFVIDLSKNQLSGTIPEELGTIDALNALDLSFNQLSGEVPISLGNLFNLLTLNLNDNDPELCTPPALINLINNLQTYNPPPAGFCEDNPTEPNPNVIRIEAENGTLYGDFTVGTEPVDNGTSYIYVPQEVGNRGNELDPDQRAEYTFTVEEDGIYRIAGILNASTVMRNSFYVQIDGYPSQGYMWHNQAEPGYHFEYVTDGPNIDIVERVLTAGEHTLTVYLRETRTLLDKIFIERVSDVLVEPMPEGCDGLVREAEAGDWEGMFTVGADQNASGGFYVHVPEGLGSRGDFPDAAQKASYCFTVEEAGTYRVKAWAYADNSFNNSFFVTVNDDTAANVGAYEKAWHTRVNTEYAPEYVTRHEVASNGEFYYPQIEVELEAGVHTVYFFLREDGTRLDKVALEPVNMTHQRMRRQPTFWPDGARTFLPFLGQ